MAILSSKVNTRDEQYTANYESMQAVVDDLQEKAGLEIKELRQEIKDLRLEVSNLSDLVSFHVENIECGFEFPNTYKEISRSDNMPVRHKIESYLLLTVSLSFAAISAAGCVWLLSNLL